jgi:vacuolar protein sorting-associated protein VTA1
LIWTLSRSALYHAAQVGISAKIKEPAARDYLFSLLTLLEVTKKEICPNDAVDNEVVAAAYVENFALRVFGVADSEDRTGKATHGTAKKFLVAASLLELLQVFDKANVSDSVSRRFVRSRFMTSLS